MRSSLPIFSIVQYIGGPVSALLIVLWPIGGTSVFAVVWLLGAVLAKLRTEKVAGVAAIVAVVFLQVLAFVSLLVMLRSHFWFAGYLVLVLIGLLVNPILVGARASSP